MAEKEAGVKRQKLYGKKVKEAYRDFCGKRFLEKCRSCIRWGMVLLLLGYLAAVVVVLPFYYDAGTGYGSVGTLKSEFFRTWGFRLARCAFIFFLLDLPLALGCFIDKNKEEKHKFALLVNDVLDGLSLTDKFAVGYIAVLCISYYYTEYRDTALMGAGGWYMGFVPHLVLLGSYFAVSRLLPDRAVSVFSRILPAVAFPVFLLGVLNRYQIDPLKIKNASPDFISTIGNINWYCGYWSVLFAFGCGLFLKLEQGAEEKRSVYFAKNVLLTLWCMVGLATGLTQGSESGLFALIAVLLAAGCVTFQEKENCFGAGRFILVLVSVCVTIVSVFAAEALFPGRNNYPSGLYSIMTNASFACAAGLAGLLLLALCFMCKRQKKRRVLQALRRVWYTGTALAVVAVVLFAALVVCNTRRPGSIGRLSEKEIFTFDSRWGSSRGATWRAGIRVFAGQDALHELVGVGPDAMAGYIYSGRDEALLEQVREQFGSARLTNAHGEWITLLADTGILGVLCFAGMMLTAMLRFFGGQKTEDAGTGEDPAGARGRAFSKGLLTACGLAVLSYTVNNIFSFEQTMNVTQIFVILGLGENRMRKKAS